jgi:hypothetical protein
MSRNTCCVYRVSPNGKETLLYQNVLWHRAIDSTILCEECDSYSCKCLKEERDKKYRRAYYQRNKSRINQYYKNKRTAIKSKNSTPEAKAKTSAYNREYYDKNREKVSNANSDRNKKAHTCECGKVVQRCTLKRHLETAIHKKAMSQKEDREWDDLAASLEEHLSQKKETNDSYVSAFDVSFESFMQSIEIIS